MKPIEELSAEESADEFVQDECPTMDENYLLRKENAALTKQIQQLRLEIIRLEEKIGKQKSSD